ncbi:MAG: hypothetical protein ACKO2F_01500 [Cyanobacteriota bacterium]
MFIDLVNELTCLSRLPMSKSRVQALLGRASILLTPYGSLVFCFLGWAVTAPFSHSAFAMGLCWWGVLLLLVSLQLERPWLEILPFPPLTVLSLHLFLRWELGGMLLLLSRNGQADVRVWIDHVADALPINALFTSCLLLVSLLNIPLMRRLPPPDQAGYPSNPSAAHFGRGELLVLTALTGVVAIGYIVVGFFSGTLDRGAAYLTWAGKFWRPDTLLVSIIRLRDLYYLLLPLLLLRYRRSFGILALFVLPTIGSIFLSLLLGGRGLLLYPAALLLGGFWIVGCHPKLIRGIVLTLLVAAMSVVVIAPVARNTPEFHQSSVVNLGSRLSAITTGFFQVNPSSAISYVGRDLYAWSDPYLFREPGISQPPAGGRGLGSLLYLWVPRALMPNRPEINDGHLIAKEIMGVPNTGLYQGRHVWFPGISLGADLYWRFRWLGVLMGGLVFGLVYAGFCRLWYLNADLNQSAYSVIFALFPSTFLQGPPLRSLSETFWNWFYEFPKYGILFFAICIFMLGIKRVMPNQRPSEGK